VQLSLLFLFFLALNEELMAEAMAATFRPRSKRIAEKLALTLLNHQAMPTSGPLVREEK